MDAGPIDMGDSDKFSPLGCLLLVALVAAVSTGVWAHCKWCGL